MCNQIFYNKNRLHYIKLYYYFTLGGKVELNNIASSKMLITVTNSSLFESVTLHRTRQPPAHLLYHLHYSDGCVLCVMSAKKSSTHIVPINLAIISILKRRKC